MVMTLRHAAQVLGISRQAVYIAVKKGRLKFSKKGVHYWFTDEQLEDYIDSRYDRSGNYDEENISPGMAAKILGIPVQRVYYLMRKKMIEAVRHGGYYLIKKQGLRHKWYESQIDSGTIPKTSHERFLQFAISKDMASKANVAWRNDMYARFFKDENRLKGVVIMKTVVRLDKFDGSSPESVPKNLPESTFIKILENYHESIKNRQ